MPDGGSLVKPERCSGSGSLFVPLDQPRLLDHRKLLADRHRRKQVTRSPDREAPATEYAHFAILQEHGVPLPSEGCAEVFSIKPADIVPLPRGFDQHATHDRDLNSLGAGDDRLLERAALQSLTIPMPRLGGGETGQAA